MNPELEQGEPPVPAFEHEAQPQERSPEEQARIDAIFASAHEGHPLKRVLHEIKGHPKEQVYWGDAIEGATCACGAHWGPADMTI